MAVDTVVASDDRPVYDAWRAGGADEELAYTATQKVREMAAVSVVTFVGSKIDAQKAELVSKIDAQKAELVSKIDAQSAKLNAQTSDLSSRIDAQKADLGARIEAQKSVLDAQTSSLRWMIGMLVAVLAAVMVLIAQALYDGPPAAPSADAGPTAQVEVPEGTVPVP